MTGRITRSAAAASSSKPPVPVLVATPVAKRPRGRPSKASIASSSASLSSAPTPTNYESGSDYSTPLTSHVATPAPTDSKVTNSSASIEIVLPTAKSALAKDSLKALNRSKYSLVPASKRKHDEIKDSEDDLDSDETRDAKLARRLQEEEYNTPDGSGSRALTQSRSGTRASVSADVKGKGKANPFISFDDDEEDEEDDEDYKLEDSDDDLPRARLRRSSALASQDKGKGKVKGKAVATEIDSDGTSALSSFVSDEEDFFTPPTTRLKPTAARATKKGKGKGKAKAAALTDSDDDEQSMPDIESDTSSEEDEDQPAALGSRRGYRRYANKKKVRTDRQRLEEQHPVLKTMWNDLKDMPVLKAGKADQPQTISRQLKPFQLEGLAWLMAMEKTKWKGGLLGDEMGLGKTIQAVSLIMSDWPAKKPTLVLAPPVALMQWTSEIQSYTDGTLKTIVYHGTNSKSKGLTVKDLKKFDVIIMSYNSLESMYRKQEKGFTRKAGIYKQNSIIHEAEFHRVILDEAHCIKTKTTMTAKACFALKVDYRWCLTGTPLQNRIGEFFSLIRFLSIEPFSNYFCRECPCSTLEWSMDESGYCNHCKHRGMRHISVFNQELLNPIQRYGNVGPGAAAFEKLRLMTDRIMLRRLKKDHTNAMELPVKEVIVDRQFFGEEENDFANSIMTNGQRKFDTYVAQGVLLNNYANIFGLIMQMRQVADHPDLILKKDSAGGQNVLVCCICDEPAEEAIRSRCKHDFCRACAKAYLLSTEQPDCPQCHIPLAIDLEQPDMEQDDTMVKKSSIINRIKMENWTSSSKIELLVHDLHRLRSDNATHKSIIFSQFTTMLQLIEWRLRRAGITTVMLDGSMTPAQRQASIEHFMNNVDVEVFLVSLKAGGVALNLTEASRVFIVDPWWNPAAEWQSADRCHRIGQTRPCTITRLCIEDSVESRMVLLQEKKTKMINSTINSDDNAMESLTPEDLQFLFRGN